MRDIGQILSGFGKEPKNLIPMLQAIQAEHGRITPEAVDRVAEELGISAGAVYGVVTFYDQFTVVPPARHVIRVCNGTSCHVRGADAVVKALERELGIAAGEATSDGLFALYMGSCPGCCAQAPAMRVGDRLYGGMTPERAANVVRDLREGGAVQGTSATEATTHRARSDKGGR